MGFHSRLKDSIGYSDNKLKVTSHLSPVTVIYHLSSVICHLSSVICHLSSVICHLSSVSCQLSAVSCQLSAVSCQISDVSSQLSNVSFQLSAAWLYFLPLLVYSPWPAVHCSISLRSWGCPGPSRLPRPKHTQLLRSTELQDEILHYTTFIYFQRFFIPPPINQFSS